MEGSCCFPLLNAGSSTLVLKLKGVVALNLAPGPWSLASFCPLYLPTVFTQDWSVMKEISHHRSPH